MKRNAACTLLLLTLIPGAVKAADWPNWRGPAYNGSSPETGLPTKFSKSENVKWAASLPGPAASTPIILGDKIFLTSTDLKEQGLIALCLDRKTGKTKWKHTVGSGYHPGGEGNDIQLESRSNYASPSPVTDGKHVIFFFGNGDLAGFDMAGNRLWDRNVQKEYGDFSFQWTFSSSPQLYAGKLYLQILQRNQPVGSRGKDGNKSFLLALDPSTGKELWKHFRPSPAQMESLEAYSTPIPHENNGRKELLIAGGDVVTGHDPATGKELWRWGTWNNGHREPWWRLVPSPVAGGGVVVVCAPKRAPVYAAKTGGNGDLGTAGLAWKSEDRSDVTSDVPTPLFYKGSFFVLSDLRKAISCVEPGTGKTLWTTPLPGNAMYWGSPTGADGKIFLINVRGEVSVVNAGDGKILHTVAMGEEDAEIRSTIAVAGGNLFVRTNSKLYCIGK